MQLFKKKVFGSGMTSLIISNEEKDDIIKMIKPFEESGSLIRGVSETIKNKAKQQKGGFIGMLLGTLSATLLWNLLTGKRLKRSNITQSRWRKGVSIPPHLSTNLQNLHLLIFYL